MYVSFDSRTCSCIRGSSFNRLSIWVTLALEVPNFLAILALEKSGLLEIKVSIFFASIMGFVFIFTGGMSLINEYFFSSHIFF